MDTEGTVVIRDMKSKEQLYTIKADNPYETGCVLFNQKMKKELFMITNNVIDIFSIDGTLIQSREIDQNIVAVT